MRSRRALVTLAAGLVLLLAGCGGDDDAGDAGSAAGDTATTAPAPAETTDTTGAAPTEPVGGVCSDVGEPEPRGEGTGQAPTALLNSDMTYTAVVTTNCGTFEIALDPEASPQTVASFVALAEDGFFDSTVFHRIVPGFVIQGGDPTATGTGGPGYSTVDTPSGDTTYTKGVVAMAKTAAEAPGTSGSQFFIVTAEDAGLPAEYAVIGKVEEGLEVVDRIAVLGDPGTELPTRPVVVQSIRIESS